MDVQFSGAVDFSPLLNNMARPPALPGASRPQCQAGNAHATMLQAQRDLLNPLAGGEAAMELSTQLALNSGVGANINIWA